jgi:hypothetical protein
VADPATIDLSQFQTPGGTPDSPQASLLVVPSLPPLPSENLNFSGGAYLGAGAVTTYDWDYGLVAQRVAGPRGGACRVVRLHGGICFKAVLWVVQRVLDMPVLPHPDTLSNGNEVLLRKLLSPCMVGDTPEGSPYFTVSGVYFYVCQVPPSEQDAIPMPVSPLATEPASQFVLNPALFVRSLIPTAPVTGNTSQAINY